MTFPTSRTVPSSRAGLPSLALAERGLVAYDLPAWSSSGPRTRTSGAGTTRDRDAALRPIGVRIVTGVMAEEPEDRQDEPGTPRVEHAERGSPCGHRTGTSDGSPPFRRRCRPRWPTPTTRTSRRRAARVCGTRSSGVAGSKCRADSRPPGPWGPSAPVATITCRARIGGGRRRRRDRRCRRRPASGDPRVAVRTGSPIEGGIRLDVVRHLATGGVAPAGRRGAPSRRPSVPG